MAVIKSLGLKVLQGTSEKLQLQFQVQSNSKYFQVIAIKNR